MPTGPLFQPADEPAGHTFQRERPYERWGSAAGRSSGLHCTKDPYCPNCSLPQEIFLNGSCQCFWFILFFLPLTRISPQQRPSYLLMSFCCRRDYFFFFFFCSSFFLPVATHLSRQYSELTKMGGSCLHWRPCWKPKGIAANDAALDYGPFLYQTWRKRRWCRHLKRRQKLWQGKSFTVWST